MPDSSDTDIATLAAQFGFSEPAARHLESAIRQGRGDMAMFDHPEFGGPGQWMRGGLLMISRPQDTALKHRVEGLCEALASRASSSVVDTVEAWGGGLAWSQADTGWWPAGLGQPSASGDNGRLAYAWFAEAGRLAIRLDGQTAVYDTGGLQVTGISQSQAGGNGRIAFSTPEGELPLAALQRVDPAAGSKRAVDTPADSTSGNPSTVTAAASPASGDEIFHAIERLGDLHDRGLLSDDEFAQKKRELLDRL